MKVATVITALALILIPMTAFAAESHNAGASDPLTAAVSHATALREQAYLVTEGRAISEKHNALVNNGVISQFTELQDIGAALLATNSDSDEAKNLIRELGYLGNFIAATEQREGV